MSKYDILWKYVKSNIEENLKMSYNEIQEVLGFAIDHSFLTYKKECLQYGFKVEKISMKNKVVVFKRI